MSSRAVLETKKTSLELKRKKNIKISNGFALLSGLLCIILFSNLYYFKNAIILNNQGLFFAIIPILFGLSLVMRSQGAEDQVFLAIMESLELLEKGPIDTEICKHAAEKFEDATNRLERFLNKSRINPSWYSKFRELEEDFVRKLKYRAVPALRGGMLGSIRTNGTIHMLEHIAMVFIEHDIEQMKVVNDLLEGYDEIVTNEKFSLRSFYVIRLFLGLLYGDFIPLPIVSIILGELMLLAFILIYSQSAGMDFYKLIFDPILFIPGSLASMSLAYNFLKERKYAPSVVEIPEDMDMIVEKESIQNERVHPNARAGADEPTADVDEIDIPEPSFPRDRWEFLWFRYTEDNRNPWGDLIAQTSKIEINFNDDWGTGIVNNSGLSNNVAFKASRTLPLDAGRYTFLIGADDGIRLYVRNNDLTKTYVEMDEWRDQEWSKFENQVPVDLPGGDYKILIEWYEHYVHARVGFKIDKLARPFNVKWNLSGAVMPTPPNGGDYGRIDIPNSNSASKLIVQELEGEVKVKIVCDMKGLRPNARYILDVIKRYTLHSKWPGRFSDTIRPEEFAADSEGYEKREFNLRSNDFPNPGTHTLSVWLNEFDHPIWPNRTILISDNFEVSVSS